MAQEIELKLAMAETGWRAMARHPVLKGAIAAARIQTLRNLYFDTPDLRLRHQRVALRLRKTGRRWLQTVKCASAAQAGLSARPEWEQAFAGRFDFSMIEDTALRAELEALRDRGSLGVVFDTTFERREWRFATDGGEVLLMADRGHIVVGERREAISEIELELAGAPVSALLDLAGRLAATLPLRAESRSKAQRGYDLLADARPVPIRAGRSPIDPQGSATAALRAIALDCIAHYQANEHGSLHSDAPEFVHQMRVALRRLRSALRVFEPALPDGVAQDIAQLLRALASDLGELRDRDVLQSELVVPALHAAPRDRDLNRLAGLLAAERARARERVLLALQDGRQARLMIALLAALQGDDTTAGPDSLSLDRLARKRLGRAHERMTQATRLAESGDIDALHALRIDVKRLRYALEFFQPLLHAERTRKQLATLTAVQEELGYINDLSQAGPRLLAAAGNDAGLLSAVARIAAAHAPRYREIVASAPALLKRLRTLPRPR
ncbi:CHAD domain-containing protein [Methyloversatilis sp.]|uniref:CYTH and CHAD domain-containing protein n=1 Tax=Methyloversatilis sp. TaxID=2569862 RepID=UPI0035B311EC